MSAYLARLKQLENGKNSHYAPDSEPSKPSKAPFEPFEGTGTGLYVKNLSDEAVLRDLVLEVMVLVGELPADWQYHVDLALADPADAMTCYSALKRELQQTIKETKYDKPTERDQAICQHGSSQHGYPARDRTA